MKHLALVIGIIATLFTASTINATAGESKKQTRKKQSQALIADKTQETAPVLNTQKAGDLVPEKTVTATPPMAPPINPYLPQYSGAVPYQVQPLFVPSLAMNPGFSGLPNSFSLPNWFGPETPGGDTWDVLLEQLRSLSALLPGDPGASRAPVSITTAPPTGERPLKVITIKCPTEAAFGVAPPPVKIIHIILTAGMDSINATQLLPFDMQQVCQ